MKSFISYCYDNTARQRLLSGERVYFSSLFHVTVPHTGTSLWPQPAGAYHITSVIRQGEQRVHSYLCLVHFFLYPSVQIPTPWDGATVVCVYRSREVNALFLFPWAPAYVQILLYRNTHIYTQIKVNYY